MDRASCIDRMRGSDEHHQFYGWGEWNHGGIFVGGACSAAVDEPEDPVYGEFVFDCRDVGSIGIAFILLFSIGKLVIQTGDITWLSFLVVYGVDGCLTICHRIMLHENLGEAHRKHAYQLMANELNMSHPVVSLVYMVLQLAVSLVMVYALPDRVLVHWVYLGIVIALLAVVYLLFMRKYYHLHERYLESLKK